MADLFQDSEALWDASRRAAVVFLRTELRVANTLLDLADTGTDLETKVRRREEARAAYIEVAEHLAKESRLTFSHGERAELTRGLDELARRFDPPSARANDVTPSEHE
jgi:hypothetical protein